MSFIFPLPSKTILSHAIGLAMQREVPFLFKVSKDFLYPYVQLEKKNNLNLPASLPFSSLLFFKMDCKAGSIEETLFRGISKGRGTAEHSVLRIRQDTPMIHHPNECHCKIS